MEVRPTGIVFIFKKVKFYDNLVDEEDGLLLLAVESEGEDGLGWIDDLPDGAGESEHVAIRILGIHHHLCANLKHSYTLFIIWS